VREISKRLQSQRLMANPSSGREFAVYSVGRHVEAVASVFLSSPYAWMGLRSESELRARR
jgi:hypothetical protein